MRKQIEDKDREAAALKNELKRLLEENTLLSLQEEPYKEAAEKLGEVMEGLLEAKRAYERMNAEMYALKARLMDEISRAGGSKLPFRKVKRRK